MATRGQQKRANRTNAELSMKDLTEKEKRAERASEQRRANRRAGNAGLSSQRLSRMEAEAERNSRTRSASAARDARAMDADLRERAKNRPKTNIKGEGTMKQIQQMASRLSPAARAGARFLGPAGAVYTAFELLRMMPESSRRSDAGQASGIRGGRSRAARATESRGSRGGRGDGAAEVRARRAQAQRNNKSGDNKEKSNNNKTDKNYNVGVSKGGVSFKEAFRHFRNKGQKTFTWNGKKYTTKLKEEN